MADSSTGNSLVMPKEKATSGNTKPPGSRPNMRTIISVCTYRKPQSTRFLSAQKVAIVSQRQLLKKEGFHSSLLANSLIAVGDEDGGIRLLESAKDEKPEFSEPYLKFRPHTNAILDLAFSPDDLLLATASGDQTSQVIDMPNQRAIFTMAGHVSSVKQVCFQPGSSSVIASSSRDGSVQIWDLRCRGFDAPVRDIVS